jgi:hypothetical protein
LSAPAAAAAPLMFEDSAHTWATSGDVSPPHIHIHSFPTVLVYKGPRFIFSWCFKLRPALSLGTGHRGTRPFALGIKTVSRPTHYWASRHLLTPYSRTGHRGTRPFAGRTAPTRQAAGQKEPAQIQGIVCTGGAVLDEAGSAVGVSRKGMFAGTCRIEPSSST